VMSPAHVTCVHVSHEDPYDTILLLSISSDLSLSVSLHPRRSAWNLTPARMNGGGLPSTEFNSLYREVLGCTFHVYTDFVHKRHGASTLACSSGLSMSSHLNLAKESFRT
jgi:hypothetical protein